MSSSSDGTEFKTIISADPTGYEAAWRKAIASTERGAAGIQANVERVNRVFESASKYLATFTLGVGAAMAITKLVEATAKMSEEAMDMARALGVTTNEATVFRAAIEDVGGAPAEFTDAARGLSKQLRENEADMNAMGLATRDASGNFRPMSDLVLDGIQVLNSYTEGVDRNMAGQKLFGKSIDSTSKLLLLSRDAMEENRAAVAELGLEVGANSVAAWQAFDAAGDRAALSVRGMVKAIGDQLLPVATDLVELFNAAMPAAITVARGALGGLTATFLAVKNGVVVLWETINAMVITVAEPVRALIEAMSRAMVGDFAGAGQAIGNIGPTISGAWDRAMGNMLASSERTQARIAALFSPDTAVGSGGGTQGTKRMPATPGKPEGQPAAAPSRMGEWQAELADKKVAIERQGMVEEQYRQMTKAEELAFWQERKALGNLSAEERIALTRKTAEVEMAGIREGFELKVGVLQAEAAAYQHNTDERLRIELEIQGKYAAGTKEYEASSRKIGEIQRQAADQQKAIREGSVQAERDSRLQELAVAEKAMQDAQQLGIVDHGQVLQALAQFEVQRNAIVFDALQQRLQVAELDRDRNPVEVEKIHREMEQLEQQHQQRMGEIRSQSLIESTRGITGVLSSVQSGWAGLIQQLATGAISIGGFIRGLFSTAAQAVLSTLAQMAAKWMAQQIAMKVFGVAMRQGSILGEAAKAGAGGVASMAAAPFPLNLTAPGFGAAMSAAALAFAPMASAAGGYDIPGTINPIVQAHAKEMILPATIAQPLRESIADGRTGGGGGGGEVVLRAVPMPGNFFMVHGTELAAAIKSLKRDFKL